MALGAYVIDEERMTGYAPGGPYLTNTARHEGRVPDKVTEPSLA
jgi:hypothetical protein